MLPSSVSFGTDAQAFSNGFEIRYRATYTPTSDGLLFINVRLGNSEIEESDFEVVVKPGVLPPPRGRADRFEFDAAYSSQSRSLPHPIHSCVSCLQPLFCHIPRCSMVLRSLPWCCTCLSCPPACMLPRNRATWTVCVYQRCPHYQKCRQFCRQKCSQKCSQKCRSSAKF